MYIGCRILSILYTYISSALELLTRNRIHGRYLQNIRGHILIASNTIIQSLFD
jgi:hypothetical protein